MNGATTLCIVTLPAATCTAPATTLAASGSVYTVTATYTATTNFATSTGTSGVGLTVTKASTTTALSALPASVTYGSENTVVLTATVTPSTSGTPSGTVTVKSGATTVCTVTLASGTGSCSPSSDTLLAVASNPYSMTASYVGDTNFTSSASSAQTLSVTTALTTTTLSFSPPSIAVGAEQTGAFTPTLTASPAGAGAPRAR